VTTATVFNVQRFSLHDGPGIRTTVFLKGCPLRCAWCHNPESMDPRPEPALKADRCLGCGICLPACDQGLTGTLQVAAPENRPDGSCIRCGACAVACPTGARQMMGRAVDAATLVDELVRDGVYHAESGGGVTFSGGEPLAPGNASFVLDCLEDLRCRGVHTAIDTCGHVDPGALQTAAAGADLVLYDLKIMGDGEHRAACGVGNERILDNLRELAGTEAAVRVRVPLIPGLTDSEANLGAIGEFLASLPRRLPVDLLPFHGMAADKYGRLDRDWSLSGAVPHTPEEIEAKAELLRAHGLDVTIGG